MNCTYKHTHTLVVCLVSFTLSLYRLNLNPVEGTTPRVASFSFCLLPSHLILDNEEKTPTETKPWRRRRRGRLFVSSWRQHTRACLIVFLLTPSSLSSLSLARCHYAITSHHRHIGIICLSLSLSSFGIDRSIRSSFF